MIADGRIKVKNDSELDRFTERGILFKDGSQLEADVVVLATGYVEAHSHDQKDGINTVAPSYGQLRDSICDLFEPEIAARLSQSGDWMTSVR